MKKYITYEDSLKGKTFTERQMHMVWMKANRSDIQSV